MLVELVAVAVLVQMVEKILKIMIIKVQDNLVVHILEVQEHILVFNNLHLEL